MQINIKNERTHRLAHELAQRTGETVTLALESRLREINEQERQKRQGLASSLLSLGEEFAAIPDIDSRPADEILYDEFGLPKDS